MKAKCIVTDPLGFLTVGEVYEIEIIGKTYFVRGTGFAVNEKNYKVMFKEL